MPFFLIIRSIDERWCDEYVYDCAAIENLTRNHPIIRKSKRP